MGIIVQKFGGSSVSDVDKIKKVAAKVVATRNEGHDVVVVVSAMGKTTDELLELAHKVDASPPRRELDMLLSTGERISMALLSMAIQAHGCDAISFTGSQSGIITNDRHFDARIIDVRPHRVEDELARGRVVIIAGYQGMSYKREITTLGRGGSDTTALAMAAALSADHAEIYSDVDGVYSADPRKIDGARHLPELSYDEMQEMASAGAKVLHHKAVEFAKKAKITIRARSTFAEGRETRIHDEGQGHGAVVSADAVAMVTISAAVPTRETIDALEDLGVVASELDFTGSLVTFALPTGDFPDWEAIKSILESEHGAAVREGFATVSFVGSGARTKVGLFLDALGTTPERFQASTLRLSAVISAADVRTVAQRVHSALVGEVG